MANITQLKLNDGRMMPQLGLGVWQIDEKQIAPAVDAALAAGYRSIDTAAMYHNEAGVGAALKASGLARDAVFITTKLWNTEHAGDAPKQALAKSLDLLGLDFVDLYLIHWPAPKWNQYVNAWKQLIELRQAGLARSIGVSNFTQAHLQRLIDETGVVPAVNQIELHPWLQQKGLRKFHLQNDIVTESWSPLAQGRLFGDPVLAGLAVKHGKTVSQIILRWHIELGLVAIPKSVHAERIQQNIDIFDFSLDAEDMLAINQLDCGKRLGPDPDIFTSA